MTDWQTHLEQFRSRELEKAMHGCPKKLFQHALELGAGAGYQSRKLVGYAEHLVSTDLNAARLRQIEHPGIEYRICDAEDIESYFPENSFDLVFASNLFEHLPAPQKSLKGISQVLMQGGIVILIMPNVAWKLASLFGFYPNVIRNIVRAGVSGRMRSLAGKYFSGAKKADHAASAPPADLAGNNLKSEEKRSRYAGIFWPMPHGAYATHREELRRYRKSRWIAEFETAGFEIIAIRKGPVSSGYGFGLDGLRRFLEDCGITTEYIYVLKRKGERSPFETYWNSTNAYAG